MQFIVLKTGGRKFRHAQCDDAGLLQMSDIQAWIKGELQPPKGRLNWHLEKSFNDGRHSPVMRVAMAEQRPPRGLI